MLVSILIFLIIFLIIVVSHEFGHYIVGKMNGIHVVEFFIGIGPKILKWNRVETEFSLRLLPFGGACVFEGADAIMDESVEPSEHSLQKASVWSRFATTIAGPLFNVLLAYVCGVILAASTGVVIPQIQSVMPDSGAEEAGLMVGDIITKINGHSLHMSEEVSFLSFYSQGQPMKITVKRGDEKLQFVVNPKYNEEDERYYIGITNGEYIKCGPLDSLKYGWYNVQYILRATLQSIRMLFTGQVGKDDLAGPVGVVKVVDETYDVAKSYGVLTVILSMVNLTLMLSANLAVMNIIPIPGLDGGKILFQLIEMVRRKPIPIEKEGLVNLAGMALLMVLVVFIFFNDISKFFR